MKKEFIVSKIETSPEDCAYVYVILTDTGINYSPTRRQQKFPENPFGIASIPITSLEDLKNLPKKILTWRSLIFVPFVLLIMPP